MDERTDKAISKVIAERARQKSLWADNAVSSDFEWLSILSEEVGELAEAVNETFFKHQKHPERGGKTNIVKEASQVAAVALAIMEYYDDEDITAKTRER